MVGARRLLAATVSITAVAACGDGSSHPDAPPADASPIFLCGVPTATITAVPGEYNGATVGAGADVMVAEGACADERFFAGSSGEDQVINVLGLTPGTYYAIELDTDEDLSFYVATGCDAEGPLAEACLLHVDLSLGDELSEIPAPPTGQFAVIIDSADDPAPPATGTYTLRIREAECVPPILACSDPVRDQCDDFRCVECMSAFDCETAGAPVCTDAGSCVAGPAQCVGDDPGEEDDGPAAAQVIAAVPPTVGNPTIVTAAVCSLGAGEADWFTFTLPVDATIRFELAWLDTAADLDLGLGEAAGLQIDSAAHDGPGPEAFVDELAAGTYYLLVDQYLPDQSSSATAYTLTLSIPECLSSFDCLSAAAPFCDTGLCVVGPSDCTGDDAADAGAGDDGPHAGRAVGGAVGVPVAFTGSACDVPREEADWFELMTSAGQGYVMDLAFDGADDFDVEVFDGQGRLLGRSWYVNPENVTLTYLPAGASFVAVTHFSGDFGGDPAAAPYTITFTKTAAQNCVTAADCAAEYSNQVYRGTCNAGGACVFIPDGTRADGAACDSGADCLSGLCSYNPFEADADASVCTIECANTDDCAALTGTACTNGFTTELCVPVCTADLECGANQRSANLTAGEPWDYFTCTLATGICSP